LLGSCFQWKRILFEGIILSIPFVGFKCISMNHLSATSSTFNSLCWVRLQDCWFTN